MKKLTTQIIKNGKSITICVLVDDATAKILNGFDEKTRHEYILSEHEINLLERRETRRHQSLDLSLENGHEFIDEDSNIEEKYIEDEQYQSLYKAISTLSKEQQWLINEIYFKGRSQVDIAKELGIDKSAISHRLERIFEKIKRFFI